LPFCNTAYSTSVSTTTSATYVAITGSSLTPPAGTYAVSFSAVVSNSNSARDIFVNLFLDTVDQGVETFQTQFQNESATITVYGKITCNGSQSINARWRVSANTGTIRNRSLIITQVLP
jgi:hypothetical protein